MVIHHLLNGVGATDDTNLLDDGMDMITGVINVNYQGDGPGTTAGNGDFGSAGQRLGGALTSNGAPVNVSFNAGTNTYVGTAGGETVFTMVINANGTYKFTQLENQQQIQMVIQEQELFVSRYVMMRRKPMMIRQKVKLEERQVMFWTMMT